MDGSDRRAHARLPALLLALLAVLVLLPPAAGALKGSAAHAGLSRPQNLVPPSVSGDPRVGGTLTCDRGRWDDTSDEPYEYQYSWVRDDELIDAAEAATYVVTGEDADPRADLCRSRDERPDGLLRVVRRGRPAAAGIPAR
jgi:hypothetical protein